MKVSQKKFDLILKKASLLIRTEIVFKIKLQKVLGYFNPVNIFFCIIKIIFFRSDLTDIPGKTISQGLP